jgi:Domain of unknown function (DUF4338)
VSTEAMSKWAGRVFCSGELELVRQVVADYRSLSRHELSLTICELLDWKRVNGRLKAQECRGWLERLGEQGWISLQPARRCGPQGPHRISASHEDDGPESELRTEVAALEPLRLEVVHGGANNASWRGWLERHHYLGYRVPVGANLRYLVRSAEGKALACLLWSSPAWKMAARDSWIGWTTAQREQNLQYIVNNSRFLILPWVRVKGLGSKILSRCARQLVWDWEQHYGYRPLLLETLVDGERFRGTIYRAANWKRVGQTQGRGRMDRDHLAGGSRKDIYVYPLCRRVQNRLRMMTAPGAVVPSGAEEDSAGQNKPDSLCFNG